MPMYLIMPAYLSRRLSDGLRVDNVSPLLYILLSPFRYVLLIVVVKRRALVEDAKVTTY